MTLVNIENYLRGFTFIFLFLTMLFYWIKATFFSTNKSNLIEIFAVSLCNILLMSLLVIRWVEAHHFPLSNLYESLLFLCWGLTLFLLYSQIKIKENYIGILISPIILFTNTFATFSLPTEMQKASSLVPALQSNWLMMHVTIMMLSYSALIFGSLLSIAFLVIQLVTNYQLQKQTDLTIVNDDLMTPLKTKLDNLSYRTLGIGFPLLTIGILSGAVWANETWGSYWSWDPKETWALITWFIYAIYLHSRIIKGWKGEKPAFIASFGFLAVWVCYLGVNIFGKGLHSYGWFT